MSLPQIRERAARHESRRGWSRGYPSHPMVDFEFKLKRPVRDALDAFRRSRPFQAEGREFTRKVRALYAALSAAYDMPAPTVGHVGPWSGDSGSSSYGPEHRILLRGKRSVLTALHEFAHARGYGETGAVWWSVNAFRLTWPKSFARLRPAREGSHFLTQGAQRTVADAETFWREFLVQEAQRQAQRAAEDQRQREAAERQRARERQRREARARSQREAREQERQLNADAQRNRPGLRYPPEGASDWEIANWNRLSPSARQSVFLRRQAEAATRQTAAPVAQPTDGDAARIKRFLNLDLSDAATARCAADDVSDESIARFRSLQID